MPAPSTPANGSARECRDARVRVLRHARVNRGVGGATITGYRAALADGADIVVKLDGDGQMDAREIPRLVAPIVQGHADYAKGNRFHELDYLRTMPRVRLFGNSLLSLVNKVASGYWNVMDPTNGFTAIHRERCSQLPLDKIDRGYFFESDMLFRLYTIRAVVRDVPMPARYGGEPAACASAAPHAVFPLKYARSAREAAVLRLFPARLQRRQPAVLPRQRVMLGRRRVRRRDTGSIRRRTACRRRRGR